MHPKLKTGPVLIYARYSSDNQRQASIDDQVRVCREFIKRGGGDPDRAEVFADYAVSGRGMDRTDFERLMSRVNTGRAGVVVTEEVGRLSRDFADSAQIFKQLQFAETPLLGVSDGIDTSAKGAKLMFAMRSLVADQYIDDLRDKTLRGLEGRALAGYATGNVPYGYHTVPVVDARGSAIGSQIEIHEGAAKIIRRIFEESSKGRSLTTIAHALNRDGVASPRVGTRHTAFGWGASTIRAILYNERYAGVWRFKERQWVKVPGTNKRRPKPRDPSEVMEQVRPELRIIDADLWATVRSRLTAVRNRYTAKRNAGDKPTGGGGVVRSASNYVLSGILVCARCGSPMSIHAGTSAAYYRCQTNRAKGTCDHSTSFREDVARREILTAIRERLLSADGLQYVRRRIAEELRDYTKNLDAEIKDRRTRLTRTEDKIRGLIDFIANGDRSDYISSTLRDLEAFARTEKAEIAALVQAAQEPLRLPSIDEVTTQVRDLDRWLTESPETGREQLRALLEEGTIRLDTTADGRAMATISLVPEPLFFAANRKRETPGVASRGSAWLPRRSGGRI
jgi:site-specific DNA recombinase